MAMEGIQCLERRIYERPLTSEPFIENQSEHISKLSLHQSLVKRKFTTKRYRRAREPSRISLRFLRRLKNKSSVFKKSFSSKGFHRFLYRSPQSCIAMLKRLESFIIHVINVIVNTIQRYFI